MIDNWRPLLYYPLGTIPIIFFTLRILVQWIQSEKHKQSYVSPIFWKLSLAGNLFLMTHYFIQVQYPFSLLQAINAVISWRNLNLLNPKRRTTTSRAVAVFFLACSLLTLAFWAQGIFVIGEVDWMRTPTKLYDSVRQYHHLSWHLIGAVGGALFASRFWIQWWQAERAQQSDLGRTFWWLSILGSVVSLVYFIRIQDTISIIFYGFGIVPYARNLILIRQKAFNLENTVEPKKLS